MNPLPAASDGSARRRWSHERAGCGVWCGMEQNFATSRWKHSLVLNFMQKLVDLRAVGLIDVARSPGASGPVIRIAGTRTSGHAIYKKAPRELPGLIDVARSPSDSGSVVQRQQLPPPRWSLRDSLSDVLFEIFAVYAHFPLIGEVLVFDGMTTQIICQSKSVDAFNSSKAQWESEHPRSKHVFRMELPPTGPSRYISAESGVLLQVKSIENEPEEVSNKLVDWYMSPMSDKCKSVTIQTRRGKVDVLCAVISDAVEVTLNVWLCIPCELCSSSIHGSITAHTDIFHRDITIFTRGAKSGVNPLRRVAHPLPPSLSLCDESYRRVCLPLVRPFLAVPIQATRLEFEGSLMIGKSKTLSVKETVLLDAEDVSSQWVKHEDGDCYTRVTMSIRLAR